MAERRILHLIAGNESWIPTDEELEAIINQFRDCTFGGDGTILVTRNAVEIHPSVQAKIGFVDPDKDLLRLAQVVTGV